MASSKDIYESHQYRANIYAAGIFRGTGPAFIDILTASLHYTLPPGLMDFTSPRSLPDFTLPDGRPDFTAPP